MNSVLLLATFCLLGVSGLGSFKYVGLSESGPEWGSKLPGTYYVDYVFPATSSIDYYINSGMNVIRLPFLWERLQPSLNGPFDASYLGLINRTVQYITVTKGAFCMLDVHNYARYNGVILGGGVEYSTFEYLWNQLATLYKGNPKVIFGLMNEPYDIPTINIQRAMQAGINGIRAAGATQLITVPGNDWTGVHSWVSGGSSAYMGAITDPLNNFMFEMHQYFDNNFSGNGACNPNFDPATIFSDATFWLRSQGKTAWLGEFGIENQPNCVDVLARTMAYLDANADVWQGLTWWAVGPWWPNYKFNLDAGKGDENLAVLKRYMPSLNAIAPTPASTPVAPTPAPQNVPASAPVSQTTTTSGRAMSTSTSTTGAPKAAPAPVSSPASSSTSTSASSPASSPANTCVTGKMKCLSSNSFSTCNWGAWGSSQTCAANTVCQQNGEYIYCVAAPANTPASSSSSTSSSAPASAPTNTPASTPVTSTTTAAPQTAPTATPVPASTPSSTPTSAPVSADTCSLGQSRCATSNSYQSCSNGRNGPVWASAQRCQTGLSCNQHGNNVYCY